MANKNIKGITIEINGDVTKLDRALGQVDKDLATTQKNLREVERLLKLDPKNVELLDQKQRLLAQGVELTSKRYESLKKALEGATASNVKFAEWEQAQASLQGQITRTENKLGDLLRKQKEFASVGYPDGAGMDALQREIDETREKSEALRQKMNDTFEALGRPISVDQYDALQRELAQSKADMDKATKASEDFANGVDDAGTEAEGAGGLIGKLNDLLGGKGGGMVVAAAAGAAAIKLAADAIKALADWTVEAVKQSAAFADEMLTLSQQTGFSTDFLQGLEYASGLVDVSTDSIVGAMRKLKQNLASDSASVVEAFDRIGIVPERLSGYGVSMEKTFQIVVEALSDVGNELERDQLAMTLFGRGADELAGVIDDGAEALYRYVEAAKETGYVLTSEELQALGAVDDAFYKLDKSMEMAKKRIAIELAPQIVELTEKLIELIETTDWQKVGEALAFELETIIPYVVELAAAIRDTAEATAELVLWMKELSKSSGADGLQFHNDGTLRTTATVRGHATGGVFEPNAPMLIGVGDNRTEREVLTPESEMRRVFREEASAMGGGGGSVIINATFAASDDELVRVLAPKLDAYYARRGAVL